jgi:hypothetical protein
MSKWILYADRLPTDEREILELVKEKCAGIEPPFHISNIGYYEDCVSFSCNGVPMQVQKRGGDESK